MNPHLKTHIKILILSGISLVLFLVAFLNVLNFMIPNLFVEGYVQPPATYWLSIPLFIISFIFFEIAHSWDEKLKREEPKQE